MSWKIKYNPSVRKKYEKLDKHILIKLKEGADRLAKSPKLGKQLSGYKNTYSYRIGTPGGEYRIIYDLIPEDKTIFIFLVGLREEVYDLLNRKNH